MSQEKIKDITITALMAAVICILGPVSVPIGPVPVSLGTFALCLAAYILGRKAVVACLVYIMLGFCGLPVFSGFTGGAAKLLGPTGGYIIGYIPMVYIAGMMAERFRKNRLLCILCMELATWVLYIFGTAWLAYQGGMSFGAALAAGVLPFILVDLAKICVAVQLGYEVHSRLVREVTEQALRKEDDR